jgi:hypothetical protein
MASRRADLGEAAVAKRHKALLVSIGAEFGKRESGAPLVVFCFHNVVFQQLD